MVQFNKVTDSSLVKTEQIICHFGEIQMEGFKKLVENQSVTFEVGEGEKGPVAKDIKLL